MFNANAYRVNMHNFHIILNLTALNVLNQVSVLEWFKLYGAVELRMVSNCGWVALTVLKYQCTFAAILSLIQTH